MGNRKLYKYMSLPEALMTIQTNCLKKQKINLKRKITNEIYCKRLGLSNKYNGIIPFSKSPEYKYKNSSIVPLSEDADILFMFNRDKLSECYDITTMDIRNAIESYYDETEYIPREDKYIECLWIDSDDDGIIELNKFIDEVQYNGYTIDKIVTDKSIRDKRYEINEGEFGTEIDDFILENILETEKKMAWRRKSPENRVFLKDFLMKCRDYYGYNFNVN